MRETQTEQRATRKAPIGREKLFTPGTLVVLDENGRDYKRLKLKYGTGEFLVHEVKNNKVGTGEVLQTISFYAGSTHATEAGVHFRRY